MVRKGSNIICTFQKVDLCLTGFLMWIQGDCAAFAKALRLQQWKAWIHPHMTCEATPEKLQSEIESISTDGTAFPHCSHASYEQYCKRCEVQIGVPTVAARDATVAQLIFAKTPNTGA